MSVQKPELLIPAGNLEKLETAVRFGADAVYAGAGPYSLRAGQTDFSLNDLAQGLDFAHKQGVKVYLAMNIFPYDADFPGMTAYLAEAVKLGVDALIISDPGLIAQVREKYPQIRIHLSTQANTLNSQAVRFWQKQGVRRIVLGRELSLAQVKDIREQVRDIELELFAHGAMCMSYSGRCLMSRHLTGRSANRGECTQPCRWEYDLKEAGRPDDEYGLEQDSRGTYVMNSKDLCMIEHIPAMVEAGVNSLKVEGRMKSPYYVALVTKVYRRALDQYQKDPARYQYDPAWKQELTRVSHRDYTTGFYFGQDERENIEKDANIRKYTFVGVVAGHKTDKHELEVKARNHLKTGDELEVIDPKAEQIIKFRVDEIKDEEGKQLQEAHNDYHVYLRTDLGSTVSQHSLLRRKIPAA